MTDPGGGIAAAERLLAAQPLVASRQVIDVSGDGRQNTGELSTADARDAAVSHGITLNGLPITSGDDPDVDGWYRANVIGGPGAFLVVANGYAAFAEAFRQKLMLEVGGLAPGRKPNPSVGQRRLRSDQTAALSVIASEAKQSRAGESSFGRDCFVARGTPRNDTAPTVAIKAAAATAALRRIPRRRRPGARCR
jgi:hypothetical protein